MKNCTVKNEFYTLTVSTLGAELISLKSADGEEYIWQGADGFWQDHAPLLFPVCGRLKDQKYTSGGTEYLMDAHGFLKNSEFAVATKEGGQITMSLSSNEETKKVYPFDFNAMATYTLDGDKITFSFKITNTGKCEMPYMFGWHPGFNLPTGDGLDINDYRLDFGENVSKLNWFYLQNGAFVCPTPKEYPIENNSYVLCEDEIYKNDTMIFTAHENKLSMYADGHPYKLELSWSENLPYLCIWKDEFNAAKFICLEPWSSVPNDGETAENFDTRKMNRLGASESETYTYTLKIKH